VSSHLVWTTSRSSKESIQIPSPRAKLVDMAKSRSEKKGQSTAPSDSKILPTDLRVGDRLTDETGEWEVIGQPYTTAGGRVVHARVQRIGEPGSWEIRNWDASRRISAKRVVAEEGKP